MQRTAYHRNGSNGYCCHSAALSAAAVLFAERQLAGLPVAKQLGRQIIVPTLYKMTNLVKNEPCDDHYEEPER